MNRICEFTCIVVDLLPDEHASLPATGRVGFRFRGRQISKENSEIRIQHDTVAGLACFKSGEGFVDLAHWEVLGLRHDIVP